MVLNDHPAIEYIHLWSNLSVVSWASDFFPFHMPFLRRLKQACNFSPFFRADVPGTSTECESFATANSAFMLRPSVLIFNTSFYIFNTLATWADNRNIVCNTLTYCVTIKTCFSFYQHLALKFFILFYAETALIFYTEFNSQTSAPSPSKVNELLSVPKTK